MPIFRWIIWKKEGNSFSLGYKTESNDFDIFSILILFIKLLLLIYKLSKMKYEISLPRKHSSLEAISISYVYSGTQ